MAASLLVSLTGACSSADPPAPEADKPSAETEKANEKASSAAATSATGAATAMACATPHRTFAVSTQDYSRIFTSTADAKAQLEASLPNAPVTYLEPGNAFERHGIAITARVFEAYRKLYPELSNPAEGERCQALIARGEIPAYAGTIDPHHTPAGETTGIASSPRRSTPARQRGPSDGAGNNGTLG
jgi:hypothetical protein